MDILLNLILSTFELRVIITAILKPRLASIAPKTRINKAKLKHELLLGAEEFFVVMTLRKIISIIISNSNNIFTNWARKA